MVSSFWANGHRRAQQGSLRPGLVWRKGALLWNLASKRLQSSPPDRATALPPSGPKLFTTWDPSWLALRPDQPLTKKLCSPLLAGYQTQRALCQCRRPLCWLSLCSPIPRGRRINPRPQNKPWLLTGLGNHTGLATAALTTAVHGGPERCASDRRRRTGGRPA
jgi:hypothetical protein